MDISGIGSWNFGDNSETVTGTDVSHTFTDNGNYTVKLTVSDEDGGRTTQTLDITVNNIEPTITDITYETEVDEGEEVTYSATATDPGADTLTYVWDFGDGTNQLSVNSDQLPVSHIYSDDGIYNGTLTVSDDDGATVTQNITTKVNNVAPSIETDLTKTAIEGDTVTFDAVISDPGNDELTITWDFGDGSDQLSVSSDQLSVKHTYATKGFYTVTITATDDGAVTTSTIDVTINNRAPVIENITGDSNINEGDTANFSATASDIGDGELTYTWNFGDNSETVTGTDVAHTFADNGNYTITLTVTDDDGAATTETLEITVNNVAPTIDEIIGETEVNEGTEVIYSAIASDPGDDELTYAWDFGDGSTAEGENVTHIFADNGNYTITLTVTDDDGAATSETLEITVNNVPPTIDEIIGETEVNEGTEVTYSAIASDLGDDILIYSWDFGDGTTEEGKDVTHTFIDNGNYTVTLTVTDEEGASTSKILDIVVNNVAPTITNLTVDNNIINEGEPANFSASATDPGDDTLTYAWDFGDGTTAEEEDVTHTFADNGNYIVTLTVSDEDGASTSQTLDITVNNVAPTIDEIIGETEVNEGAEVTYSAIATDPGDDELAYSWDFGDGSTAEGENVTHIFADNGNYIITLTVTDDDGAATTETLEITVNNVAPTIDEIIGETEVNEGTEVTYSAIASDPGDDELTYAWDFGDGTDLALGKNVDHIFADNGLYNARLTVTDDDGAVTSQSITITVNNVTPVIDPWLDQTVNEGETMSFNTSFSDPGILDGHTITWDFGDGSEVISETINSSELTTYTVVVYQV